MGKIRRIAKKTRKLAGKAAKSDIGRQAAKEEMKVAAGILQKLAQKLRMKAKKIK